MINECVLHYRELTSRESGGAFFADAYGTPAGVKGLGVRVSGQNEVPVSQMARKVNGIAPQPLTVALANTRRINK
jgi:hypothetical protein